jgi:hypothetical protein
MEKHQRNCLFSATFFAGKNKHGTNGWAQPFFVRFWATPRCVRWCFLIGKSIDKAEESKNRTIHSDTLLSAVIRKAVGTSN